MKLLLIRHGQTLINTKGILHYTNDFVSLNPEGRREANTLIPVCKKNLVRMIYSSPENRAKDTAEIIARGLKLQIEIKEEFRERRWGKWEGKQWEVIERYLNTMSLPQRFTFIPPGGESWEQVETRILHGLQSILTKNYPVIAIVTHIGILRMLIPLLRKTDRYTGISYEFKPGSLSIFETTDEEGVYQELLMNDTSHLLAQ